MNQNNENQKANLLDIYRNYLFALSERKEYGDLYGDTEEMLLMYEEKLERKHIKKLLRRENKSLK